MKLFFCFFFLAASCGLSVGIIREYIFYAAPDSWTKAQLYCKKTNYRDLATISTNDEHQRLQSIGKNDISIWIGLQRIDVPRNTWMWPDNEPVTNFYWLTGRPLTDLFSTANNCGGMFNGLWVNDDCTWAHSFYCYRFLILVNETKTWEEALQYCSTHYSGLASLPYDTQLQQAKMELAQTQTDSTWIGLRYIDGKWFWLGEDVLGTQPPTTNVSLPSCPAKPHCCGAFNTKTNVWENQDCTKKLNFLCWR